MSRLFILILSAIIILSGCGPTIIDNLEKHQLSFDSLPDTVKTIYRIQAQKSDTSTEYSVISTDKSTNFKHEHTGMDDGILTVMTRGFNHHFYINGQHFKLQANQGDPFILHDKHLYYSLELNLSHHNFKNAKYISVNLKDNLKH